MRQEIAHRRLLKLVLAFFFIAFSGLGWLFANDFNVANNEGFDPLRYEYYARSDLPPYLQDNSTYSIVILLKSIYTYLPNYYGFLLFVFTCTAIIILSDNSKNINAIVFSPITFFYIAQTGKDGFSILSTAAIVLLSKQKPKVQSLGLFFIITITVFIRPAIIIILFLTFILFTKGLKQSILAALIFSGFFLIFFNSSDQLPLLEVTVADENSGKLAQILRELTFGYSILPILDRVMLLFFSPIIQPIAALIKVINSGELYILFEGLCQAAFLWTVIRSKKLVPFFLNSTPFVLLISIASPFYHFRYMAITYPLIFFYTIATTNIQNRQKRTQYLSIFRICIPRN